MTTILGTYFTKEQLYADLKGDRITVETDVINKSRKGDEKAIYDIGLCYHNKSQFDKAMAWYLLAANIKGSNGQNAIGWQYYQGYGVPKNYLCALKWLLMAAKQNNAHSIIHIANLLENGHGATLNKYKALEWFSQANNSAGRSRLKQQGLHRSGRDKTKSLQQLIKETEAILETEKKTLEEEKYKTQDETEQFEQLKVTYKVADGKVDGPDDVPILIPEDKEQDESSANVSTVNFDEEILGLKTQIQLSGQEQNISEVQVKQLQLLTLEKSHLEFQMKEKTNKVNSLESDLKVLKHGKATMENQIKANDAKISLLEGENQQLKMKNFNLEDRVKEKDSKVTSLHTENQALQKEKATFEYKLKAKDDKINSLENENASLKREKSTFEQQINTKDTRISSLENETYIYRSSSLQHTQSLKSLKKEKDTIEQDKRQTINEMDRLKMLNMTLEQSLKSKDDTIASLNRENQNLSTTNQGHQQRTTEMTETYKNLLQSKGNEMELLKQNMELLLANEKQRNDALEDENRVLKRESTQHKAGVQNRAPLSDGISPSNVGSSHGNSSYSDTDYDTEFGNTEESDSNNDINYDTPSENEDS